MERGTASLAGLGAGRPIVRGGALADRAGPTPEGARSADGSGVPSSARLRALFHLLQFRDEPAGTPVPGEEEELVRRRSLVGIAAAAAITFGVVAPQLAGSAPNEDPRAERERVRVSFNFGRLPF